MTRLVYFLVKTTSHILNKQHWFFLFEQLENSVMSTSHQKPIHPLRISILYEHSQNVNTADLSHTGVCIVLHHIHSFKWQSIEFWVWTCLESLWPNGLHTGYANQRTARLKQPFFILFYQSSKISFSLITHYWHFWKFV